MVDVCLSAGGKLGVACGDCNNVDPVVMIDFGIPKA